MNDIEWSFSLPNFSPSRLLCEADPLIILLNILWIWLQISRFSVLLRVNRVNGNQSSAKNPRGSYAYATRSLGIRYRCDVCARNVLMINWCWNQRDTALFDCDERILRFVTVVATRYERIRRFSLQSLVDMGSGDDKMPERWAVNNSQAKCVYKSQSVISISWARAHVNFPCLLSEHWLYWL
jgi:hypothetical protein